MKFNLTKYFMISRRKQIYGNLCRFIASHSGIASVDNWGGGGRPNIDKLCLVSSISFEIDCF